MKKNFACATMLSLMFIACTGADEVANSVVDKNEVAKTVVANSAVGENEAVKASAANSAVGENEAVKTAIVNSSHCSLNSANAGKKAYLTNTENVGYQIVIPDMHVDIDYDNEEVQIERVGDTLRVVPESEILTNLNIMCYAYYTFNIPATETDIKNFEYFGRVFDVVPGPAPEKAPDTLFHLTHVEDNGYAEDVYDTTCTVCTYNLDASGVYRSKCTEIHCGVHSSSSRASLLYLKP